MSRVLNRREGALLGAPFLQAPSEPPHLLELHPPHQAYSLLRPAMMAETRIRKLIAATSDAAKPRYLPKSARRALFSLKAISQGSMITAPHYGSDSADEP